MAWWSDSVGRRDAGAAPTALDLLSLAAASTFCDTTQIQLDTNVLAHIAQALAGPPLMYKLVQYCICKMPNKLYMYIVCNLWQRLASNETILD